VPDDDRKIRRLGDETKGRIAELASGWTVDGESPPAPPVPELAIKREASAPNKVARDAARRQAKTGPPPPPGSPERKAIEDRPPASPASASPAAAKPSGPPPVPRDRPRTSQVPTTGKPPARDGVPGGALAESDKTKENRGAVGMGADSDSLTTNAASGTIGGDTPPPVFDRAAIAAGQKGALATDWVDSGPAARGTPKPDALPDAPPAPRAPAPPPARPDSAQLAVPVGEFDHAETVIEQDKLRIAHGQATIVRDAASALLGEPEPLTVGDASPGEVLRDPTRDALDEWSESRGRGPAGSAGGEGVFPLSIDEWSESRGRGPAGPAGGEGVFPLSIDVRGERTDISASSTGRFERGDPTQGDERGDATATAVPATRQAASGTLRSPAALPRRRGVWGDIRYVATVVLGLRAARRELAELAAKQATRQQARRHHLVTLGRTAVALPDFPQAGRNAVDHPALGPAREQLASIEDERSQHAGHVVAADSELTRVGRDREAKAKQYATDVAALDTELASFAKRLEPLEKEVAGLRRRAADMHESLRRIDAKIAATEAPLTQDKGKSIDRAQVQAELATLRADRKAIQGDEPPLAAELDALNPRIAAIEAARLEAQRKRAELETAEHDDQRRVEELLAAIGAKRKVVDRAAADAEAARDKVLFQLGDRLYVDRPADLAPQLAPIDEIDVELGLADRRTMELREILSSVDRWKLARGIALLVIIIGGLGALAAWWFYFGPSM
jgi:prefoldin subunit 5